MRLADVRLQARTCPGGQPDDCADPEDGECHQAAYPDDYLRLMVRGAGAVLNRQGGYRAGNGENQRDYGSPRPGLGAGPGHPGCDIQLTTFSEIHPSTLSRPGA